MGGKKHWKDLSPRKRAVVVTASAAQTLLAAAAYRDLVQRPAEAVRGPKVVWGLAILVNWVGPIGYFVLGRKTPPDAA